MDLDPAATSATSVSPVISAAATAAATAAYEAALPADPRVERKKMFGMPCAFVNRQMFFGTFEASVVARVGPDRVRALASQPGMGTFTPQADRPWHDYVQVDVSVAPYGQSGQSGQSGLSALALEALAWTVKLPAKLPRPKPTKAEKTAKQKAAKQKAASQKAAKLEVSTQDAD